MPAFEQLNAITSRIYTGISRSPVPVLLPFDTAFYLSDRASGVPDSVSPSHYQSGFRPVEMFTAGASGYDAVFALPPGHGNGAPERV